MHPLHTLVLAFAAAWSSVAARPADGALLPTGGLFERAADQSAFVTTVTKKQVVSHILRSWEQQWPTQVSQVKYTVTKNHKPVVRSRTITLKSTATVHPTVVQEAQVATGTTRLVTLASQVVYTTTVSKKAVVRTSTSTHIATQTITLDSTFAVATASPSSTSSTTTPTTSSSSKPKTTSTTSSSKPKTSAQNAIVTTTMPVVSTVTVSLLAILVAAEADTPGPSRRLSVSPKARRRRSGALL